MENLLFLLSLSAGMLLYSEVKWSEVAQSCPTLCDPIDSSPPGSPVPGILQARTLEWVAISFSSAWKWKVKVKSLSCVRLLVTPWTAAYQAPLSMGFSRQEYWSGVPLPSPLYSETSHQLCVYFEIQISQINAWFVSFMYQCQRDELIFFFIPQRWPVILVAVFLCH